MRAALSELIASSAERNEDFIALSGDHGYALFDAIRSRRPAQFVNVGIMEPGMVGIAAGLAKTGFKPMVYGLAAFVPLRVLEQIKMDICYSKLPVIFIGDGAGLVYSTLGSSHQCAEDIAALKPLPNIRIYAPCDDEELRACFEEAMDYAGPAYIRIGKSDRPIVNTTPLTSTAAHWVGKPFIRSKTCVVTTGSMTAIGKQVAEEHGLAQVSVFRLKPLAERTLEFLACFERLIVIEEHSRHGGLASTITDAFVDESLLMPRMKVLSLQEHFAHRCGSYQYALSEHLLDDRSIVEQIPALLA